VPQKDFDGLPREPWKLLPEELDICHALQRAADEFDAMPIYFQADADEFHRSIQRTMSIIMSRPTIRNHPTIFVTDDDLNNSLRSDSAGG